MSQTIDLRVLARYLDRVATEPERAAVDAWMQDDPARRAMLAQLETAWRADMEELGAAADAGGVWARLARQLELSSAEPHAAVAPSRVLRLVPAGASKPAAARAARWAAAAAVIVAVGAGGWHAVRSRVPGEPAIAQMREYLTPRGQRASFRLADGTEVTLNAESRLRVPLAFGAAGAPRTVELDGEGYFTVVHDERRPFTVRTARGFTRDVGTRFGLRAYADDSLEQVIVAEGEVAVRTKAAPSEAPVRAGQMATVAPNGNVVVAAADLSRETAWAAGRLEFRDITLGDAARRLGRWYGLDIRVESPALASRRVSGSYADEPIADVLTVLTATVGARYEWRGRDVNLFSADPSR